MKESHEIRDAIHGFVRLTTRERRLIDSPAIQRLRHVHQLATTFMVYPGATHSRFEHSLGVADLATRIFGVVVREDNLRPVQDRLGMDRDEIEYWGRVLRVAALCHDTGHLPFSHAAEYELLPSGWNHEQITRALIYEGSLADGIRMMSPPVTPQDVAKVALSPDNLSREEAESLTDWEAIVSEILTGSVFGADRMDYLLRDSHHTGVEYGRFDQHRLIDTIRILPAPPADDRQRRSSELTLGVEAGGLQTAESLLLARYFMFKQVYYHRVRRIYDLHLMDFLKAWLPGGRFATDLASHLGLSDPKVIAAIQDAAADAELPGHDAAHRMLTRRHYRRVYEPRPADMHVTSDPGLAVYEALCSELGTENVKRDVSHDVGGIGSDFPVALEGGEIASALSLSQVLQLQLPMRFDVVYVKPEMAEHARKYLGVHVNVILEKHASMEGKKDE